MVKWGITMIIEHTIGKEKFVRFWVRLEKMLGHSISWTEADRIMNEMEKEIKNDRCKNLP